MKNNSKNILWICGIAWMFDDNTYFPEANYPGIVSGSAFQQAIIEGLELQGYHINILSDCDIFSGERIEWSHNGNNKDIRVAGNCNKFLRIPKKIKELSSEIKKKTTLLDIDYVIAYEMHIPYLICLRLIKKINPSIKTILICPDLSLYMDLNLKNKNIKSYLKKIEYQIDKKLLKSVDGYVLFTEQMYDYFSDYGKKYVVVEGVYRDKFLLNDVKKKNYIMHAGTLQYKTGIEELIEAFEKIKVNDVELWFFGSGPLEGFIKYKAENNFKIKYKGFVDPKDLFEYEKQATLLVNVRNPNEEYTKYSFPSKTFEYLASGTIFLSTELPGIPDDYKEHMILIPDNSIESIKKGLEEVLALTEKQRQIIGRKARQFVIDKKNKISQSKKIISLLEEM